MNFHPYPLCNVPPNPSNVPSNLAEFRSAHLYPNPESQPVIRTALSLYQSLLNRFTLSRAEEIDCYGALKLLFQPTIQDVGFNLKKTENGMVTVPILNNPLICCGADQSNFRTAPLPFFKDKCGGLQFVVPSPMSSVWGVNQSGERSMHTLDNTGPRKYLVV